MSKNTNVDVEQYHTGLSKKLVEGALYVILVGDPGRVMMLAQAFDVNAKHIKSTRGLTSYLATFYEQKILVCSTGMGASSITIVAEELAMCGLKFMLRTGTCGTLQSNINLGDLIISSASVRLDGVSVDYAPIEYPAVSSIEFTNDFLLAAKNASVAYHVGITASTSTFYPGQERYDNYSGYVLRRLNKSLEEWRTLKVLSFDMETAALFTLCSVFGLHSACICGVGVKRTPNEEASQCGCTVSCEARKSWEKVIVDGIYQSMCRTGIINHDESCEK